MKKISEAVSLIEEALRDSGYSDKVQLGIDCAASEFYNNFSYRLAGKEVSKKGLIEIYQDLVDKHNFVSIEDPFNQEEFEAFASLNAGLRGKAQVVGDDLLVTNARRIATAIEKSSCSCLLLKVNQIGTVTEAINACRTAQKNKWSVTVSHRSGETEDSLVKRYVWNYYNRVPRIMRAIESANSWTYTVATFQQANANTANQLDFIIGVAEVEVEAQVVALAQNTDTTGITVYVGIGEDSTTTPTSGFIGGATALLPVASRATTVRSSLRSYPAIGRHFWAWLEQSTATGTTTWLGDNASEANTQSGIHGSLLG